MPSRTVAALAALVVLMVGLIAWWFNRVPVVPAVRLTTVALVRSLQFSGRVATLSRVDVGSTLTGRVAQVMVTAGAQVK